MRGAAIKRFVIPTLVVAAICFAIMRTVGALAINPGVGEGVDIPPDSLRYQLGLWADSYGVIFAVIAFYPVMIASSCGLDTQRQWIWYAGLLLASFGWVLLWHSSRRWLCQIRGSRRCDATKQV